MAKNKAVAFGLLTVGGIMVYSGLHGTSIMETLSGSVGATLNPGGGTALDQQPTETPSEKVVGGLDNLPGGTGFNIHTAAFEAHQMGLKVDEFGPSIGQKFSDADTGVHPVHAANSCHYKGKAFDAVGTGLQMNNFALSMATEHKPQLSELIHNPGFSIKDGKDVPPSFWGTVVWNQHRNHVHIAVGC